MVNGHWRYPAYIAGLLLKEYHHNLWPEIWYVLWTSRNMFGSKSITLMRWCRFHPMRRSYTMFINGTELIAGWCLRFLPLWKKCKSIGMLKFPIHGKIKMFQTTNQIVAGFHNHPQYAVKDIDPQRGELEVVPTPAFLGGNSTPHKFGIGKLLMR